MTRLAAVHAARGQGPSCARARRERCRDDRLGQADVTHPEPPIAGDETATLLGSLERVRAFADWKSVDSTRQGSG